MRKFWVSTILSVCLLLSGCGGTPLTSVGSSGSSSSVSSEEPVSEQVFAMDTYMTVTAYGEHAQAAVEASVAEIERLDALLSIGSADSEISKLNADGSAQLSADSAALIAKALELYTSTGGAYDITVLPLMELWGFTTENYHVPTDSELTAVLEKVGAEQLTWDADTDTLTLASGQSIDLGGIAKGYTSGRIMEIFQQYGVEHGMVSLGGNVHLMGGKTDGSAWRVGIQDPNDSEAMLGVLEAENFAVITSGGYERYFEQDGVTYHHILDPATGKPADSGLISVTIVSADGTLADGLSTSLFVMGKDKALAYWRAHADEFDAILMETDGTITVTDGISDTFTAANDQTFTVASHT